MILMIDNYDSFTYNLVHMLYAMNVEVEVKRNDKISCDEIAKMENLEAIIFSPGPGTPSKAGAMEEIIKTFYTKIPMLGVCLGHQAIGEVFGAKVVKAQQVMHGKISTIAHTNTSIFANLKNNFKAVRYHSLALEKNNIPECLEVIANSDDGEIMAIRHKQYPVYGVQYHIESIMSSCGKQLLTNFLNEVTSC